MERIQNKSTLNRLVTNFLAHMKILCLGISIIAIIGIITAVIVYVEAIVYHHLTGVYLPQPHLDILMGIHFVILSMVITSLASAIMEL